jgi:hypothetical protein
MKKLILIALLAFTKVDAQIITTVGGNGTQGYSGDGGQATNAELSAPNGVAFDTAGNMYIADESNNLIRKVSPGGIISTVAGTGTLGYSGDGGQATNAALYNPWIVIADVSGNLYISDATNNRVRMVNTSGIITTVAGNGTQGYSGDGGQATDAALYYPSGIAFDASGNLFIADSHNERIRMINTSGIITTIAGMGTAGFTGDGGQATAAEINTPYGVSINQANNIYI